MGKSYVPKYRVEYIDQQRRNFSVQNACCWKGRATEKRLEEWRHSLNKSFCAGGVNDHVSEAFGYVLHISGARIVKQKTGEIVCEVKAPMFEVI